MKGGDSSGKRAGIRNLHAIASILLIGTSEGNRKHTYKKPETKKNKKAARKQIWRG